MTNQIQSLIQLSTSGSFQEQLESIEKLAEFNAQECILKLIEILPTEKIVLQLTIAEALGYLGRESKHRELIGATLIELASSPEELLRSEAIEALGTLKYIPALEVVKQAAMNDPDALVRASAAESLGEFDSISALEALRRSLTDWDDSVRAYSANSFGLVASATELPELDLYLAMESSQQVKAEILGAQCRLGSAQACIDLIDYVDSVDVSYMWNVLNLVEDLLYRKIPENLILHSTNLRDALIHLADRSLIHRQQVESILEQLEDTNPNLN